MWRRPGWSGTGTGPAVSRWLPKFLSIKIVETEFDSLFLRSLPLSLLPLYVSNGYTASKTKPDRIPPASVSRFAGKGTGLGRRIWRHMSVLIGCHGQKWGFKNGNGRYRTVPDGHNTTLARNRRAKQNKNVGEAR